MILDEQKPLSVLVVEDDRVNFMLLEKLLRKSMLEVEEIESAPNLEAALEIISDHAFDIIFLDLNLPDSNGLETVTEIHKKSADAAIIVVTGAYDDNLGPETIRCGAQEYLRKGRYDVELLTQSVRYALERKHYERTIKNSEERYRKLFEEAMDAIIISDAKAGTIIDCNKEAARLLKRDKSEIIGQDQDVLLPNIQSDFDGNCSMETELAVSDGQIRRIAVKVNTFKLEEQEIIQKIFRDVTEFKVTG